MNKWIVLLALLLTACSSSESVKTHMYVLPDSKPSTQLVFSAVSVHMPHYLQGPGIVYRLSETEIRVANHNLWAGNLNQLVTKRINNYQATEPSGDTALKLEFERFNGAYTGRAELKGKWQYAEQAGEFDIEEPLQDGGYDALVQALDKGLGRVLSDIAKQIEN